MIKEKLESISLYSLTEKSFETEREYKAFLEALRALGKDLSEQGTSRASFICDIACEQVKPSEEREPKTYATCHNLCVRIWHHRNSAPTISVPLRRNGRNGTTIVTEELSASGFEIAKHGRNKVDLLLSLAERTRTFTNTLC